MNEPASTSYQRPVNRFGYLVGRDKPAFAASVVAVEGQELAVTAAQPVVPVTRGEKTIRYNRAEQALAVMALADPSPPRRAPVQWTQTRLQAPAALEASRSRTDMLSEQIARQGGG